MKNQKKQMCLLLAVLMIMTAGYFGLKSYNEKTEEEKLAKEETEKIMVTDFSTEDITAFSYQLEDATLSFQKEDTWKYDENKELLLEESQITSMLDAAANLEALQEITPEGSLSEYGLDTPENILTFVTENGTTTLKIGMENTTTNQYYIQKNDETKLYLVSTDLTSVFYKTVEELEQEDTEETEEMEETEE